MKTSISLFITGILTFFMIGNSHSSEEKNIQEKNSPLPSQIDVWITQLGHQDYNQREEAKKNILSLRPPVLFIYEHLHKEMEKTADLERKLRIKEILKEFQLQYEEEKMLQSHDLPLKIMILPFFKQHLAHLEKIRDPQKKEVGKAALLSYIVPYLPFKEKKIIFTTWLGKDIFFLSEGGKSLVTVPKEQFIRGVLGNAKYRNLHAKNLNILKLSIYSLKEALANKIYGCNFVVQKSRLPLEEDSYLVKFESNFTDSFGGADYFLFREINGTYKIVANWEKGWIHKSTTTKMDKKAMGPQT